ncbi:P-type ATPase [Reticulomyxa filosa]|uniref:P-type ATPase n=1 Tax=Reticulomyxa filosa TaxID=46433 RepID=X6MXN3_RETFI|nr:P-type ATPase [Reticulomyxa filosa]|eukprot:ETO18591.1 P-type ATPase [Reticulomyxa filosa]
MVANVPEGLPTTVVSLLTIIAKRLAEKNVNVKRLQNVETLGSCTVIASDKTGTITQNNMSVSQLWMDLQCFTADYARAEMPSSTMINTLAEYVRMPFLMETQVSSVDVLQGVRGQSSPNVILAASQDAATYAKDQEKHVSFTSDSEAVMRLVRTFANLELVAAICNRARGDEIDANATYPCGKKSKIRKARAEIDGKIKQDSQRKVLGDASDKALFRFVSNRQSVELLRYQYRILFEIPFSSSKKFALVVVQPLGSQRKFILMKGAPEIVLEKCKHFQLHGASHVINSEFLQAFDVAYASFARDGERVLGFAMLEMADSFAEEKEKTEDSSVADAEEKKPETGLNAANLPMTGYTFLGMISLVDPPKPKVATAVEEVRNAGVKVIMVTGDHPLTAVAIANQVGIMKHPLRSAMALEMGCKEEEIDEKDVLAVVVTGRELNSFKEEDWTRVLSKEEIVFARTTPEQKLAIVEHLQAMGHVVAVTGDGVNDAPALKKADIGVAMGINGSDVARSAGAIILMDDDFSSIVVGIREGRLLFDNIMNTIAYTLTHLLPEVMPTVLNIVFDLPLAMGSVPVLAIDCGTELAPAIALAYEKAESDVMLRKPRDSKKDRLVTLRLMAYSYAVCGIVEFLVGWLGFMLVFKYHDIPMKDLIWSATDYWATDSNDYHLSNGKVLSASQQVEILNQGQAMYWFLIVSAQFFHVFFVRTRNQSVFTRGLFIMSFSIME